MFNLVNMLFSRWVSFTIHYSHTVKVTVICDKEMKSEPARPCAAGSVSPKRDARQVIAHFCHVMGSVRKAQMGSRKTVCNKNAVPPHIFILWQSLDNREILEISSVLCCSLFLCILSKALWQVDTPWRSSSGQKELVKVNSRQTN